MLLDNHPINTNSFGDTEEEDENDKSENHTANVEQDNRDGRVYIGDSYNIEDQNYGDNLEYHVNSDDKVDHVENDDQLDDDDKVDQNSISIMNGVGARVAKFFAPAAEIVPRRFLYLKGEIFRK